MPITDSDLATLPPESARASVYVACSSCKRKTHHDVVHDVNVEHRDDDDVDDDWYYVEGYAIVRCQGCREHSFLQRWEQPLIGEESTTITQYPDPKPARATLEHWQKLPVKVRKIYKETERALAANLPVLTAIGIRALVEAVARHKKAKGVNLMQKINDLTKQGNLSAPEAKVLHKMRFMGNSAAHEIASPPSQSLNAAMRIAEHLLQTVFLLSHVAREVTVKSAKKR